MFQGFTIEVVNLDKTIAALAELDAGLAVELKNAISELAAPTLAKAKGYARGLGVAPSGQYASSLRLKKRKTGVSFVSNDPGGGVIEFAHLGAVLLTGPYRGRRAPVPRTGTPPRALLRAILEDEDQLIRDLNDAVSEFADGCVQIG
ncbi:hypothetical protein K6V98_00155 [Collinsella sp. AGMB00827]|uniref:HK97 gp10 family phage protein n=1 Tax=Collinsella ureilytica TaxID=2869515 RepID=A0ABS7MHF1_9ACTN|nr:hypothetical protein [Collinsella urealyticum]MBY4796782.1 hypothetical protein [Collinsella urealyticum]